MKRAYVVPDGVKSHLFTNCGLNFCCGGRLNLRENRVTISIFLLCALFVALVGSLIFNPISQATASSNIYYVSPGGNDENPGNEDQPFKTIQKAADTAQAGDIVYVKAGEYSERVIFSKSGTADNRIVFEAHQSDQVIVAKGYVVKGEYYTISKFEVTPGDPDLTRWDESQVTIFGSNNIIKSPYIHDTYTKGGIRINGGLGESYGGSSNIVTDARIINSGGIHFEGAASDNLIKNGIVAYSTGKLLHLCGSNNIIDGLEMHDPGRVGTGGNDADGVNIAGSGHIIRNSKIYNVFKQHEGQHTDLIQWWAGVSDLVFENNTFGSFAIGGPFAMRDGGNFIMIEGPSPRVTWRNNVFLGSNTYIFNFHPVNMPDADDWAIVNNTFYVTGKIRDNANLANWTLKNNIFRSNMTEFANGASFNIDYNLYVGGARKSSFDGKGSIESASVLFVNDNIASSTNYGRDADFRLQLGNPAIDAGTSEDAPITDRDGRARYDALDTTDTGGGELTYYDIGAYERWDVMPPSISIQSFSNSDTVSGIVDITASASDDTGIEKVKFYINNDLVCSEDSSTVDDSYKFSWDSRLVSNGYHWIKVVAYDISGLSSEATVTVNINNVAPQPSPPSGSSGGGAQLVPVAENQVVINDGKEYTKDRLVTIKCHLGNKPVAVAISNDGRDWSSPIEYVLGGQLLWMLTPGDGKKTVYTKFHDETLNWGSPISTTIILDSIPPRVDISEAISTAEISTSIDHRDILAQVSDEHGIDKVDFYLNGDLVTTDSEAPYEYRWAYNPSVRGCYTFKVMAYDKAGNAGQELRRFLVGQPIYKDVSTDHWALLFIEELNQRSITGGFVDGTFRPAENVTRAQLAKMVVLAMGWDTTGSFNRSFSDVPEDHWAYSYIETARAHGVLDGYKDGTFKPGKNVTRAEIAKIIAISKGYDSSLTANVFADIYDCWARNYVIACSREGIISGYPGGLFKPQSSATRAEVAKMIAIVLE